jgi:hypothetical protein
VSLPDWSIDPAAFDRAVAQASQASGIEIHSTLVDPEVANRAYAAGLDLAGHAAQEAAVRAGYVDPESDVSFGEQIARTGGRAAGSGLGGVIGGPIGAEIGGQLGESLGGMLADLVTGPGRTEKALVEPVRFVRLVIDDRPHRDGTVGVHRYMVDAVGTVADHPRRVRWITIVDPKTGKEISAIKAAEHLSEVIEVPAEYQRGWVITK